MFFWFGIIIFSIVVLISIAWHECGHMWMAQLTGMKVRRYFVGFGPKVWSTHKNGTEYGIKAIPLGGFCDIAGMYAIDDVAPEDMDRAMFRQKPWKRIVVLLAGPVQNLILALVAIFIAALIVGLPSDKGVVVAKTDCVPAKQISATALEKCDGIGPAELAGLRQGDVITGVNGQENLALDAILDVISTSEAPVQLTVKRKSQVLHFTVNPKPSLRYRYDRNGEVINDTSGNPVLHQVSAIGIRVGVIHTYSFSDAIPATLSYTGNLFHLTWQGVISMPNKVGALWTALLGGKRDLDTPTSLYGTAVIGGHLADHGQWYKFVMLLISLNFFLAVFNLLPLLPLDGGHIAVAIFEKLRNTYRQMRGLTAADPVDFTKLAPITVIVMILGGAYMLLALGADIVNPIKI